jgi:hypothetical protein
VRGAVVALAVAAKAVQTANKPKKRHASKGG